MFLQIDRILADFYGHETEGGHAGGKRVQRETAKKFYWRTMTTDITEYVS